MSDTDPMITVELNADRNPVRFTAEQFGLMTQAGVFAKTDGKTELVRGVLYSVQSRFAPHARNRDELAFVIESVLGADGEYCLGRAARVRLSGTSVVQPDLAILRRSEAQGEVLHANAIALAIEIVAVDAEAGAGPRVADYAAAGVPGLWIVEIATGLVHVFEGPATGGYASRRAVRFGDPILLKPLAGVEIVVPAGGFA